MPKRTPYLERAREAVAAGKIWRAKEILQGAVGSEPFDEALYESYGALLLSMGDDVEAGRYLFASGASSQAYDAAVALFLDRYGRGGGESLLASLPAKVKRRSADELPPRVRAEFSRRGYVVRTRAAERGGGSELSVDAASRLGRAGDAVKALVSLAIVLWLAGAFVVGLVTTLKWLWRAIVGLM